MPHIKAKSGINWHVDVEGEGDHLLFIHGWGVDKRIWRQQSKYFSQFSKVCTIDLPGHGKTSWRKTTLEVMGEDLAYLIDEMQLDNLTIIGSSMGGLLSLQLYDLFPEKVKGLVFVGSMPKFSKSEDYPYGLDVEQIRKLSGQLDNAYPSVVQIFFRSLFTREERESRRFKWLMKFRQTDEAPMKKALAEYLDILETVDLRETLKKVAIPLQFINGEGDEICNQDTVGYIKSLVPQARFDQFEKCGHFPFLSRPHEFNQILNEFLQGLD